MQQTPSATVDAHRSHSAKTPNIKYVTEYSVRSNYLIPTRITLPSLHQHQTEARTMGHFKRAPTKETSAGPCLLREEEPKKEKRKQSIEEPVGVIHFLLGANFLICPRLDPRYNVEHEAVKFANHMNSCKFPICFFPLVFMCALSRVSLSFFFFFFFGLVIRFFYFLRADSAMQASKHVHAPMLAMPHATQNGSIDRLSPAPLQTWRTPSKQHPWPIRQAAFARGSPSCAAAAAEAAPGCCG
ncbi:hypothetical protein J3458_005667 [Metarhizium acridum]|uniref:uncharacterized protein n=1 Tax=Metarhizium acridum TaxID=92637 RepID=UPI001C6B6A4A|nr:hypothetical protein J3458_005667 [Metarhizium acridum]